MNPTLESCLEDLEERIDPDEEDRLYQSWLDFIHDRCADVYFFPHRKQLFMQKSKGQRFPTTAPWKIMSTWPCNNIACVRSSWN